MANSISKLHGALECRMEEFEARMDSMQNSIVGNKADHYTLAARVDVLEIRQHVEYFFAVLFRV